uniref:Uncharacterized protein n=1 Tax=Lepeophtheirus salmonis TaxID=72036 RepID=A0A0K2VD37_LEPSM
MIKFVGGNYMDVVAFIPVIKLNGEFLYRKYILTMKTLYQIIFIALAVLVDNHPVNRKFFPHFLCGGELQTSITHPHNINRKFHPIFDPVNDFNNIYKGFQRQEYFTIHLNRLGVKSSLHPNFAQINLHYKVSRKSSETTIEAIIDPVCD